MSEEVIAELLSGAIDLQEVVRWLISEDTRDGQFFTFGKERCAKADFVANFVAFIKNQTDCMLQTPADNNQSEASTKSDQNDPLRGIHPLSPKTIESPKKLNQSADSNDSFKTPNKRASLFSPVTPLNNSIDGFRFSTPKNPSSVRKCNFETPPHENNRKNNRSMNLGDFIVSASAERNKKKRAQKPTSVGPDVSDHDAFPAITEKRRINPTKIRAERVANANDAFKQKTTEEQTSGFEIERSILKKDRHKLMEKFNILTPLKINSRATALKTQTSKMNPNTSYIDADIAKISLKDKLDILISIYSTLLQNNLILNQSYEYYYLISLIIAKQSTTDYINSDSLDYILKTIHNCVYFSVKTLSRARTTFSLFLDKSSLRILSQNKILSRFDPDFAEYLATQHFRRMEPHRILDVIVPESNFSNRNVCFESETDGVENFPREQNFRNFRKQRDMFYDIFRHWENRNTKAEQSALVTMQRQIKTLLLIDGTPTNLAHLARLFTKQMVSSCLHHTKDKATQEEMAILQSEIGTSLTPDKLSKLAKRLEGSQREAGAIKTGFFGTQEFFRDFVVCSDSASFRDHLRDSLASQLTEQDTTISINHCENLDRDKRFDKAVCQEFIQNIRMLQILGKFLGFIISLPYIDPQDTFYYGSNCSGATTSRKCSIPKDAVFSNEISLRDQIQPPIDLLLSLKNSYNLGRLNLTIPWIVEYMSMLDYTAFRLKCYKNTIEFLFFINDSVDFSMAVCRKCAEMESQGNHLRSECLLCSTGDPSKLPEHNYIILKSPKAFSTAYLMALESAVLIKMCLGVLFECPNFPQDQFYAWLPRRPALEESRMESSASLDGSSVVDGCEVMARPDALPLLDEAALREICPYVREVFTLLNSCQANGNRRQLSYRHITPVSIQTDVQARSKEKELQTRLLDQFLRSQPSSTRRTIDFVSERVSSVIIKRLVATRIAHSKKKASSAMAACVLESRTSGAKDVDLSKKLHQIMTDMTRVTIETCKNITFCMARRKSMTALKALIPTNPLNDKTEGNKLKRNDNSSDSYLCRVAAKNITRRVENWLHEHCTPAIYCKDVDALLKTLLRTKIDVLTVMVSDAGDPPKPGSDEEDFADEETTESNISNNDSINSRLVVNEKEFNEKNIAPTTILVYMNELIWRCLQNGGKNSRDLIYSMLIKTLHLGKKCLDDSNLFIDPTSKKVIGQISIDLVIFIACFQPSLVTEPTLKLFEAMWDRCSPRKVDSHALDDSDEDLFVRRDLDDLKLEQPDQNLHFISDDEAENGPTSSGGVQASVFNSSILENSISLEKSTDVSKDLLQSDMSSECLVEDQRNEEPYSFFDTILCPRNILMTAQSGAQNLTAVWDAITTLLLYLLKEKFLDEGSLTEQCLAIYRQDWPQIILENLSGCMRNISITHKPSPGNKGSKFKMFLEFLSEFCDSMEPMPC